MAITFVQANSTSAGGNVTTGTYTITLPSSPSIGNTVFVKWDVFNYACAVISVIDNAGNSYAQLLANSDSYSYDTELWWCSSLAASAVSFTITITFTASTGTTGQYAAAIEFSGVGVLDNSNINAIAAGGSSGTTVTNAAANTTAGDLTLAMVLANGGTTINSPADGETYSAWYVQSGVYGTSVAQGSYRIEHAFVTSTASWAWSAGMPNSGALLATFKPGLVSVTYMPFTQTQFFVSDVYIQ